MAESRSVLWPRFKDFMAVSITIANELRVYCRPVFHHRNFVSGGGSGGGRVSESKKGE
jgi:hypothetical protein